MEGIRKELQALTSRLDRLAVGGGKRNKRKGKPRNGNRVVAPQVQNPAVRRRQRTGRVGPGRVINPEGTVVIARCELLEEVKGSKNGNKGAIYLQPLKFTWLKGLAGSFDRVSWVSASVIWKPAVGTNSDGLICYGVDWNSNTVPNTRAGILALTPIADHPVWQSTEANPLILPASKLQSRKDYAVTGDSTVPAFDKGPGVLAWAITSEDVKVYGELWIHYHVRLFGTA